VAQGRRGRDAVVGVPAALVSDVAGYLFWTGYSEQAGGAHPNHSDGAALPLAAVLTIAVAAAVG
jgi:hypothetical protein